MQKLSDRLDRPIVLVGLMGAGKSTVGRRLARRLGLPFVDSDAEIEDAAGLDPDDPQFGPRWASSAWTIESTTSPCAPLPLLMWI